MNKMNTKLIAVAVLAASGLGIGVIELSKNIYPVIPVTPIAGIPQVASLNGDSDMTQGFFKILDSDEKAHQKAYEKAHPQSERDEAARKLSEQLDQFDTKYDPKNEDPCLVNVSKC